MAIAFVSAANSSNSTVDATSFVVPAFTPGANELQLLAVATRIFAGTPAVPTITNGQGLTYTKIADVQFNSNTCRLSFWWAIGAAPTNGTITFDFSGVTQECIAWSIRQYTGTATTTPVVQNATNTGATVTSILATLAAFANVGNATFGAIATCNASAITAGSGFGAGGQQNVATPSLRLIIESQLANDTTVDATFSSDYVGLIAIEVAIASSGGIAHIVGPGGIIVGSFLVSGPSLVGRGA